MRALLAIRGPMRPSLDICKRNISKLKEQLDSVVDFDSVYVHFNDDSSSEVINSEIADSYILTRDPNEDIELIRDKIMKGDGDKEDRRFINDFRTMTKMRAISQFVDNSYSRYDWVIQTRADLEIEMGSIFDFMIDNSYCFPNHTVFGQQCSKVDKGFCDQFGVAKPDIFKKVWDFDSYEFLREIMGKSIAECLPIYILEKNKVNTKIINTPIARLSHRTGSY